LAGFVSTVAEHRFGGSCSERRSSISLEQGIKVATKEPASGTDLSPEQNYLRRIDMRIKMLSGQAPESSELARMQAARADVLSRISPQELAAYEKAVDPAKTREQLAAEAEAERVAMEANRDKPAI
jgi:hypothetical protein